MTYEEIADALEEGKKIIWRHPGFVVTKKHVNPACEYETYHFTRDNDKILIVRGGEGYQCLLSASHLRDCYIEK